MNTSASTFMPPSDLVKSIPQIGEINLTLGFSDYVENLPDPQLNSEGITDPEILSKISDLQKAMDRDITTAKNHAAYYYQTVMVDLLQTYDNLRYFAQGYMTHAGYRLLYQSYQANNNLSLVQNGFSKIQQRIKQFLLQAQDSLTVVNTYNANIKADQAQFSSDYAKEKSTLSNISGNVTALDNKITELQNQISENNRKVTEIAVEEGLNFVQEGILCAVSAASGDEEEAVKSGATLAFEFIKSGVRIVILDVNTIKAINEVAQLTDQLNLEENDLQILNNVGSMLSSMTNSGMISTTTLNTLISYWQSMDDYLDHLIASLNNNQPVTLTDPDAVSSAWSNQIALPLGAFIDAGNTMSATSTWVHGKVQFDTLENLKNYTA
jgi:hypothetical protein